MQDTQQSNMQHELTLDIEGLFETAKFSNYQMVNAVPGREVVVDFFSILPGKFEAKAQSRIIMTEIGFKEFRDFIANYRLEGEVPVEGLSVVPLTEDGSK